MLAEGGPSCVAIELSGRAIQNYATALDLPPAQALQALAQTLAANLDACVEPLTLIARGGDSPILAWIGFMDPVLRTRLETQARALEPTCAHLRYVGYPEAEAACRQLAPSLVSRFGQEELPRAHFTAIPNGGFVILGLLASLLGLSRRQLAAPEDENTLLVVVDDCAISGYRFRQFLGSCRNRRIVFAPLLSPPPLRVAIQAADDRVLACLSGADLHEIPGSVSAEHQERRRDRLASGDRYWLGSTEPLCFPWNEPDRTLWNPAAERHERAWRVVPPELCLKNRVASGRHPIPVQIQPTARGRLRPGHRVLFAEIDGEVVLCTLKDCRTYRLGDTGSILWRGGVIAGDLEAAIGTLIRERDAPEERVREDARRFVEDLVALGFLTEAGE